MTIIEKLYEEGFDYNDLERCTIIYKIPNNENDIILIYKESIMDSTQSDSDDDDYTIYFYEDDCSVRGTLASIIDELWGFCESRNLTIKDLQQVYAWELEKER